MLPLPKVCVFAVVMFSAVIIVVVIVVMMVVIVDCTDAVSVVVGVAVSTISKVSKSAPHDL